MSDDIFLSLETERALLLGEHCVFGISSVFNALALFCLIRETLPHQKEIRVYLMFIQVNLHISRRKLDVVLPFVQYTFHGDKN